MSPERQTQSPFTLFPLNESAIADGRIWLQKNAHSPDMLETEKEKMKNRDPDMYLFIYNMGFLRKIVLFEDDDRKQNAYWNALYMLRALESSYNSLWKETPHPSQDTMNTHFFNLLDVELHHHAMEKLTPQSFEKEKKFHTLITEFLDGYGTTLFDELVHTYGMNSLDGVHALFDQTPELEMALTRGSLQQTHGPALGLVYGAFDTYEIFRLHEEGKLWEEKWDIPMK